MTKRFPAFSPSDLQTVRAFLMTVAGSNENMTASEVVAVIDGLMGSAGLWPPQESAMKSANIGSGFTCPSCGKGVVVLWPRVSAQVGAEVYGCRRCMWSEMR